MLWDQTVFHCSFLIFLHEAYYKSKKLYQIIGKDGGFVMSVGIGEMEGSNPKLVKCWVDATKQFGTF